MILKILLTAFLAARPAAAQDAYGSRGIYPVYESGEQWLIFNKSNRRIGADSPLSRGNRFLIVGSEGADLFTVGRSSLTYGGACKERRPLALDAALLRGARAAVGSPIIAIHVPQKFSLKGSRAKYQALANEVSEDTYNALKGPLLDAIKDEIRSGAFRFKLEDSPSPEFIANPRAEAIAMQIEFGARLPVAGLAEPFVMIEGAQVMSTYRRCLRLADGGKLVGGCVELPRTLMAETALLRFVAYDPSGRGTSPFLLAFTPTAPLWGHERWGIVLKKSGPRLFLMDAMDQRCRDAF